MSKYQIECVLQAETSSGVDLGGKTWDDVDNWYVKWDTLHVLFVGNSEYTEIALNSEVQDVVDWKHPNSVNVFAVKSDGKVDYDNELLKGKM